MTWKYQYLGSPPDTSQNDYSNGEITFWQSNSRYGVSATVPSPTNDIWVKFDCPIVFGTWYGGGIRVSINLGDYQAGRYDGNNHDDYDNTLDCIINVFDIDDNTVAYPFEFKLNQEIGGDWSGWHTPTDTTTTTIIHFQKKEDCYLAEFWGDGQLLESYEIPRINDPEAFFTPIDTSDDFLQVSIVSTFSDCSNFIISNDALVSDDTPTVASIELNFDLARQPYFDNKRWTICKLKDTRHYMDLPLYLSEPVDLHGYEFFVPATKEIWIKSKIKKIRDNASYPSTPRLFISARTTKDLLLLAGLAELNEEFDIYANSVRKIWAKHSVDSYGQSVQCIIHMISNAETGLVEVIWEDENIAIWQGNVNDGDFFDTFTCYGEGDRFRVSDLVISNKELTFDDKAFEEQDITFSLRRDLGNGGTYYRTLNFDIARNVYRSIPVDITFDLERYLSHSGTWRYDCAIDTERNIHYLLSANIDLQRDITQSIDNLIDVKRYIIHTVSLLADTARTLPHKIFSSPIEHSGDTPDVNNTCAGLQNFEIRLGEQQLTDFVNFTITKPINIMEQVKGHYLDYKFDMRVESLKQRGILYSCNCCSDIDDLLFKQIEYKVPENEQWHWADGSPEVYGVPDSTFKKPEDTPPAVEASVHVAHIAAVLNKNYVMQFDNFVSTVDGDSGGVTYNDLIRSIFGWSSRIPHKLINCYIRDDTLFVIQRGHESNVIDLSNSITDIVSVDRNLVRTIWGSSIWSKTETRSEHIGWNEIYNKDDNKTKQSQNGNANYSYDNSGLVTQTSIYNDDGSTTYIDYQYTELSNGRKVLASESHSTYKGGERIDYQHIQHTYLNQGQSHVMAIGEDGDYLGSNVGQSVGDDRVTPWGKYTSSVIQSVHKDKERTIYGLTNFDSSFPIDGDKKLKEITSDIIWLNRKTQEIITINLYNYNHVIDFNDRILLNGSEYFLKSNVAIQTSRIVNKQTLSIVRWF